MPDHRRERKLMTEYKFIIFDFVLWVLVRMPYCFICCGGGGGGGGVVISMYLC